MPNVVPIKRSVNATPDRSPDLFELRCRVVEVAALVTAAAELASALGASPAAERVHALLAVAERNADETVAAVERVMQPASDAAPATRAAHRAGRR